MLNVILAVALVVGAAIEAPAEGPLELGLWRAVLESPGGELPFEIEIGESSVGLTATIRNGPERIPIPRVERKEESLVLGIDHYDSRIVARIDPSGTRLEGEWTKTAGEDRLARLAFSATHDSKHRFKPERGPQAATPPTSIEGRWRVKFAKSDDLAVATFQQTGDQLLGTFLTTTGDYRYLAGSYEHGRLRLSVFDGAHAFLFDARRRGDGSLHGGFWSRDSWHEEWEAWPDPEAKLDDPFAETVWNEGVSLDQLRFPDLDGKQWSLADPKFAGKALVLQIFGSWCPNCQDACTTMTGFYQRYRERGLSVVGLAFELTDDQRRNAEMVRRYANRHGVTYPLLLAGPSDKRKATVAFKALDRIRSYPTTVFLHSDGRVRAIHTGFTGPATGEAFERLKGEFAAIIEELLAEQAGSR